MKVWQLEPSPDVNKSYQFLLAALAPSGLHHTREDSFHFSETCNFPGGQLCTVTKRGPGCLPEDWARWIIRNCWWVADCVRSHLNCVSKQRHWSFPTSRETDWEFSTAQATQWTNSINLYTESASLCGSWSSESPEYTEKKYEADAEKALGHYHAQPEGKVKKIA